jgi:hypothetical protein
MTESTDNKAGFAIVDWDETFEVNDKGGPRKAGQPFRRGPLPYVRIPTVGTAARRWAMIERVTNSDGLQVEAVFGKLIRSVGGMDRPERDGGILRGVDGAPATIDDIAEMLGQPVETIRRAVEVLLDRRVGLLREVTEDEQPKPQEPQEDDTGPGNSPEILGDPRLLADANGIWSGAGQGQEQQQEQRQEQAQEHPPGTPAGPACSALSLLDSAFSALRTAYGENPTIMNFATWFWQRYEKSGENKIRTVSEMVYRLIEKSKSANGEPAAFFIGAAKKSPEDGGFGYVPVSKRRG